MKKTNFLVFSIFSISSLLLSSCSIFINVQDKPIIEEPSEEIPDDEKPGEENADEEEREDNGTIRFGLNFDFGSGAAYSAFNRGYFIEEGLTPEAVVTGEEDYVEALLSG